VITAVDTSVLRDVFGADPSFGRSSGDAVRRCLTEGQLVACDVVWAETAASFTSARAAVEAMDRLNVGFSGLDLDSSTAAGAAWRAYRNRGGKRERLIADFLIGAHALQRADRLLTRDRGFYRAYFKGLAILDPTQRVR
jgi:predicted nucleic acid-binding protein